MPELDPTTLAERVLRLSRSTPFEHLGTEALSLLAAAGREETVPTRTVLVHAGERAAAHYLPLAGRLRVLSRGREVPLAQAQLGLGALSMLAGGLLPADLVADAGTVLLVIDEDALLALLEEHGRLSRAVLRVIATHLRDQRQSGPVPRTGDRVSAPPRLDLVARMLLLREALRLAGDGMGAVARLARVARGARFAPGTAAWSPGQVADIVIVLEGALRLVRPGAGERRVNPVEVLGLVESVAGVPMKEQAIVLEPTTALVLSHPELSETIEDDDALSLELIRSFAAQLWSELEGSPPPEDG